MEWVDTDADLVRQLCPVMLGYTSGGLCPQPCYLSTLQASVHTHYAGACKANSHVLTCPLVPCSPTSSSINKLIISYVNEKHLRLGSLPNISVVQYTTWNIEGSMCWAFPYFCCCLTSKWQIFLYCKVRRLISATVWTSSGKTTDRCDPRKQIIQRVTY